MPGVVKTASEAGSGADGVLARPVVASVGAFRVFLVGSIDVRFTFVCQEQEQEQEQGHGHGHGQGQGQGQVHGQGH